MPRWTALLPAVASLACLSTGAAAETDPAPPGVQVLDSAKGKIFATADGKALYYYDFDTFTREPSCIDACAAAWPPLIAPAGTTQIGDWNVMKRPDGTMQWAYKGKPAYGFAGDAAAGDMRGDNVQRRWHLVKFERPLPKLSAPPSVVLMRNGETILLTDLEGRPLYRQGAGDAACDAGCKRAYVRFAAPQLAQNIGDFTVVTASDGARQWAFKGAPLFRYDGDSDPGKPAGEIARAWASVTID